MALVKRNCCITRWQAALSLLETESLSFTKLCAEELRLLQSNKDVPCDGEHTCSLPCEGLPNMTRKLLYVKSPNNDCQNKFQG